MVNKEKKFIGKFKVNYDENLIWKCPNKSKAINSEYIIEKEMFSALFSKDNCDKCKFAYKCVKKDYDESFNKVEIMSIYLSKKEIDICNNSIKKTDNYNKSENIEKDFILTEDGLKYIGNAWEVIIPKYIDNKIVEKIAEEGFINKKMRKIILPNTLKVIGRLAFANCKRIEEISIPDSVTDIEGYAFDRCYNLEKVILPREIDYIGPYAFSETKIKKIVLPENIRNLSHSLFYECSNLREVVLNNGIEEIGEYTFSGCGNLMKINIPNGLKKITACSFEGCGSLTSIRIPDSLEDLSNTAFLNCINLQTIETNNINKRVTNNKSYYEKLKAMVGGREEVVPIDIEYDTIYNTVIDGVYGLDRLAKKGINSMNLIKVVPIKDGNFEIEEKYEDILNKGVEFKRQGEYNKAKSMYIKAIKMDPKKSTAYYNLGKILYILGEFEASARAYKTSFELGVDPYNVLIHLGHALIDQESKNNKFKSVVSWYEDGINPYSVNIEEYCRFKKHQPSSSLLDEYQNKCVAQAKSYLGIE